MLVTLCTAHLFSPVIKVNNYIVGHLMDPWNLPGLAHFCEHMLFLGTDKYPSENEYSKFISSHGGITNAYTATDHTNYHFDIAPEHLHVGLFHLVFAKN